MTATDSHSQAESREKIIRLSPPFLRVSVILVHLLIEDTLVLSPFVEMKMLQKAPLFHLTVR